MSTPPRISAVSSTRPDKLKTYQLARLIRGKARSWAPIIIGIKKLPSVVGIDGIKKNHTMTTPCMVNMRLYIEGCSKPAGVARCSRIKVAANPPTKKKNVIDPKNNSAMRLWSLVSSQEPIVFSSLA